MKTLAKLLYVEADEEITDLVDRLRDLSLEDEVTFVVPERARALQSAMSFRLLKRYADSYGKRVNLVSGDPRLQAMSLEAGFTAYPSMAAYDIGTQVHQPSPISESEVISAPARPTPPAAAGTPAGSAVATLDRPRQAAVLSAPPKKTVPQPSKPVLSGPPLKVYRPYAIGAGVLVVLALLLGLLYVPTASATLFVSGTPLKEDITLNGAVGAQNSGTSFATQAVHASESQDLPGTATGQKQVDAVKASGQVVFTTYCQGLFCPSGSLTVSSGTQVSTQDGSKNYVTTKSVSVALPRGSTAAPIAAVQAGAGGNTGSHTITSIPGNQDDYLSVDNTDAVTTGADARTATVIQQSDIDSVKDAYSKDAIPRVQDQLNSKAQGLKLVPVGSGVQATVTSDHKVGDEVGGMTVTVKVSGDGVAFDDKAVKALLKAALERKVPQGSQLTNNMTLTYDPVNAAADGHIQLNGHASGFYTPIFLETAIRSHIKGMSPSKAHAFLQSLPNVVDARIVQSPFGLPWLPLFTSRISLKIQEVTSPSSS